ncbi:uncharacterized protein [Penaeus vannamei]|uniref:uncharacterized protein n=1 Tax=Penaeus vannamei TaxID=6689 RepID=UPI00387F87FC
MKALSPPPLAAVFLLCVSWARPALPQSCPSYLHRRHLPLHAGGFVPYSTLACSHFSAGVLPYSYGVQPYHLRGQARAPPTMVQPGYVAQTKGSTHIAPLPSGLGYASHHINVADAPGTQ